MLPALPQVGSLLAFAVAVLCVLVAVLVRIPLDALAQAPLPPYITFSPAIVTAGFLGGIRAGLVSCVLSIAIAWVFFIAPYNSLSIATVRDGLSIVVYAFTGSLMAFVSGFARLLLERLKTSEEARAQQARESVHRINNLLAVTQALSQQTLRRSASLEEYGAAFTRRLAALSKAQDILVTVTSQAADLKSMIHVAIEPFGGEAAIKVTPGPPATIPAQLVSGLTLAIYELGTNALKYGALGAADGRVEISWACVAERCALTWRESGVAAAASAGGGLGGMLIRSALSACPDTRVEYEITPAGVTAIFEWPLPPSQPAAD